MILDSYHIDLEKFSTQTDYIYSGFFFILVSSHSGAKVNQNKKNTIENLVSFLNI